MTQAILKTCTAKVRRAAVEDCGGKLRAVKDRGMVCPNSEVHLNPLLTGFCNSGWHEGYKIDKPTCRFWVTCPCDCHTQLSRIAALTSTERVMIDNSTWTSGNTFVQVSLNESMRAAVEARPNVTRVASELPGLMPDQYVREFSPTASGRAQRGQLESWVQSAAQRWMTRRMAGEDVDPCTPVMLSEDIRQHEELAKAPSTGAIDAVFKRWAEIGYANIGHKPTRFVSYTMAGINDGLEVLKGKAKRR